MNNAAFHQKNSPASISGMRPAKEAAFAGNAQDALFHYYKRKEHYRNERWKDAISSFTKAIGLTPLNMHDCFYMRALAKIQLKEYAGAIKDLKEAMRRGHSASTCYNTIGIAHRYSGNFRKACIYFKNVINLDPFDAGAHDNLAKAYAALGNNAEADKLHQKAAELRKNYGVRK